MYEKRYEKLVSYYSDIAEKDGKFVVSSRIQTCLFGSATLPIDW
jgi:hypothetical protein